MITLQAGTLRKSVEGFVARENCDPQSLKERVLTPRGFHGTHALERWILQARSDRLNLSLSLSPVFGPRREAHRLPVTKDKALRPDTSKGPPRGRRRQGGKRSVP